MNGAIAPPPGPSPAQTTPPPPPPMDGDIYDQNPHRVVMHPTFFWGKNAEILFSGWPGTHSCMYGLSLIFITVLSVLVEMLSYSQFMKSSANDNNNLLGGAAETIVHGVRVWLAYMVMLALMSFNGGIFIAAVAGHCLGFFLFRSRVFRNNSQRSSAHDPSSLGCSFLQFYVIGN